MDRTAPAILDLGLLLLLAALAGRGARALVVVTKVGLVWLMARLAKLEARRLQLAVGLGQVGEFSYVLGALALGAGLISTQVSAALVAAVVLSIAASSILVRVGYRSQEVGA